MIIFGYWLYFAQLILNSITIFTLKAVFSQKIKVVFYFIILLLF